jgi:hypothetical protein
MSLSVEMGVQKGRNRPQITLLVAFELKGYWIIADKRVQIPGTRVVPGTSIAILLEIQ